MGDRPDNPGVVLLDWINLFDLEFDGMIDRCISLREVFAFILVLISVFGFGGLCIYYGYALGRIKK